MVTGMYALWSVQGRDLVCIRGKGCHVEECLLETVVELLDRQGGAAVYILSGDQCKCKYEES